MAFAITKVQAYGIESEEPVNKRYRQYMMLTLTAAATDVALDLGSNQTGSLGTFWTATSGTTVGAGALQAIQDIVTRAEAFSDFGGEWMTRSQANATSGLITYDSAVSTGGAATEALTVTGLAVADTIYAVSQLTKGANATALNSWTDTGRTVNLLTVGWTGNPGAGSIVRVLVKKAAGSLSPAAGQFTVTYANHTPNITFASGDAPTAYEISLEWILSQQSEPVSYFAST
jgi:hypothetical protein